MKKHSLLGMAFIRLFVGVSILSVTPTSVGQSVGEILELPPVIESENGLLDITLTLEYGDHTAAGYALLDTRLLGGTLPGPTIKVRAGDTMKILFQNQLRAQPGRNEGKNEYSFPDTSNLHFHGAHVSGELPSDDSTLKVSPGEEYQYETVFPEDHMPGTHWIHPHFHGSSGLQTGGGAGMALIVQDPENYLPTEIEQADDVIIFVQLIDIDELSHVQRRSGDELFRIETVDEGIARNVGKDFRLVNGQYQPTIITAPGQWQRWRITHGGWLKEPLDISIDDDSCEMQLLSKDGIYIRDFPRTIDMAPIPSGGRADIMVRCMTAGDYTVLDYGGTLLHLRVQGNAVTNSSPMPQWTPPTIPTYLQDLTSATLTDEIASDGCSCKTLFHSRGQCLDGSEHCVNGYAFEYDKYLHTIVLNSVVERELHGIREHPYHQHVYPFQLVDDDLANGRGDSAISTYFQKGDYHDVIMIESTNVVTVRFLPTIHLGKMMVHCHRLNHEDVGMMAQELVIEPTNNVTGSAVGENGMNVAEDGNGDGVCMCGETSSSPSANSATATTIGVSLFTILFFVWL